MIMTVIRADRSRTLMPGVFNCSVHLGSKLGKITSATGMVVSRHTHMHTAAETV